MESADGYLLSQLQLPNATTIGIKLIQEFEAVGVEEVTVSIFEPTTKAGDELKLRFPDRAACVFSCTSQSPSNYRPSRSKLDHRFLVKYDWLSFVDPILKACDTFVVNGAPLDTLEKKESTPVMLIGTTTGKPSVALPNDVEVTVSTTSFKRSQAQGRGQCPPSER